MASPLTLWICQPTAKHARFVQPDANNALRTVGASIWRRRICARDIGRPPAARSRAVPARHAVGKRHDPHAWRCRSSSGWSGN